MTSKLTCISLLLALASAPALAGDGDLDGTVRLSMIAPGTGGETIADTGSKITAGTTAGLDLALTYRLRGQWALELAVVPASLDLSTNGGVNGGEEAGSVWAVPTTLTVLYRVPLYGKYSPYVGAGVNYGLFFGYDLPPDLEAIGLRDIELSSDIGFTLQAGLDYDLGNTWYASVDVKYLDWKADAELHDLGVFDTVRMELDPWIIGLGVGYRF